MALRGGALAASLLALPACYTVGLTTASHLTPGERMTAEITDQGRVALGERIGPEIRTLGGMYVGESNGDVTLRVTDVTDLNGQRTTWSGETVTLKREYVKDLYERQFSRGRTAVVVGAVAAGAVVFIVTRGLIGGGSGGNGPGGEGGGTGQTSRVPAP